MISFRKVLYSLILSLGGLYILAAYSSFTREIWIDEFLHFAYGSHHSTAETWHSINDTLPHFNHGQTGIHMLISYWLLSLFGASSFWLRFPSILAGAFMLYMAVRLARNIGFNLVWCLILLGIFFIESNLMYYIGEARPYIILASAVIGTLAFYMVPSDKRTLSTKLLGAIAITLGVLFHPYFSIYWLGLAIFGYFYSTTTTKIGINNAFLKFIQHCEPIISLPAALAYFILAKLTWMRASPVFELDPFQWIRPAGLFGTFTDISHFQFLGRFLWIGLSILIVVAIALIFPGPRNNPNFRRQIAPIALILIALAISFFLSYLSYRRNYWILTRQWVASMALVCFGFTWFIYEFSIFLSSRLRYANLACIALMLTLNIKMAIPIVKIKSHDVHSCIVSLIYRDPQHKQPTIPSYPLSVPKNNDEWVAAANVNIREGGPVWPVFRKFYGKNYE